MQSRAFIALFIYLSVGLEASEVTVYIMDNGIRADHVVFEGIDIESVDLVRSGAHAASVAGNKSRPATCGDHATLVAGLVVKRVPSAKLISVRTLDEAGNGKWSDFLRGVHWILNHHRPGQPAVANLSLGGHPEDERIRRLMTQAIDQLVADGVTVVVAAGNEGEDVPDRIPSTLDSVISVGAVSLLNFRLRESNYGNCADVYAPGENLRGPGCGSAKSRILKSGTSMAAAVVTGFVAAHLADYPGKSPEELKQWVLMKSKKGKVRNLPKWVSENALLFTGDELRG